MVSLSEDTGTRLLTREAAVLLPWGSGAWAVTVPMKQMTPHDGISRLVLASGINHG
jgi:hypothetical protein